MTPLELSQPMTQCIDINTLPNLDTLCNVAMTCTRCRLSEGRTQVVYSDGNPNAKIVFIGEGPGQQEDETGIPFVGRAGQLLTKIIESVEFSRKDDTYICNIVKCRPPLNRAPFDDEAEACSDYLTAQLKFVGPKIIVLVGKTALTYLLNNNTPISKIRGQWLNSPKFPNAKIMPIFHPSYLLRNPSSNTGTPKWLTWQDMIEIRRVYDTL